MSEIKESRPEYHLSLRERPVSERPREKLRSLGASSLTDGELLAIILRTGSRHLTAVDLANHLLVRFHGLGGLAQVSFAELCKTKGVGLAKAAQLKAALELGRRLTLLNPEERPIVRSPADVANLVRARLDEGLNQEQLWVVLLNSRNAVLGMRMIYQGSVNSIQVRPAEAFREAILRGAVALVVVHTHPSGDPSPSQEDVAVTKQIVQAGHTLGIEVLDHVILGRQPAFVSLKERGLGFD